MWRRLGPFPACFFFRLQYSHWSVHVLEAILKPPNHLRPSPAKANVVKRVPLSFLTFQGNIQNRTCLKVPFGFFSALCDFFSNIFMSPKGPPSSFLIFCNGMYVKNIQKGPPLTFFGTMWLFLKEKNFQKFQFFSKMFCTVWALDMAPTLDVLVFFYKSEPVQLFFTFSQRHSS